MSLLFRDTARRLSLTKTMIHGGIQRMMPNQTDVDVEDCEMCGAKGDLLMRSCVECGMTLCYKCKKVKFEKLGKGRYTCGERRHARRRKDRDFAQGRVESTEFLVNPGRSLALPSMGSRSRHVRHLANVFPISKVTILAEFKGTKVYRRQVRRSSKKIRRDVAETHPARRLLDWPDMVVSRGPPLGAALCDEWSVTNVTFGRCTRGLRPLLAFCFQHRRVPHEVMRSSVSIVVSFLGTAVKTNLCVIVVDSSKRYRVSGREASGGWWGRFEICDMSNGMTYADPSQSRLSCNREGNEERRTSLESTNGTQTVDVRRGWSGLSPRHSSPRHSLSPRHLSSPTHSPTVQSPEPFFGSTEDDSDEHGQLVGRAASCDSPSFAREATGTEEKGTDSEYKNYFERAAAIHSRWLIRINRDASKSWGTHTVTVNDEEILRLVKRTKLHRFFRDDDGVLDRDIGHELAHYLCLALSKMTRPSKSCNGDDDLYIPIPHNFVNWLSHFEDQVIRGIEPETGCVHGDCLVELENGMKRRARDVLPGDVVRTSGTLLRFNRVECVVHQRFDPNDNAVNVCRVSDECMVTPDHPVRRYPGDGWIAPKRIVPILSRHVDVLCNFVLEEDASSTSGHAVLVDGVECVTLGHLSTDPSIEHPLWGRRGIRRYLKESAGYPRVVWYGRLSSNKLRDMEQRVMRLNDD